MAQAGAIVLAAGQGRRFGGGKLLARLDGRPLLQHVLDAAAAAELRPVIVVLGQDAPALAESIDWRDEHSVVNPDPGRGLSSSLRLGLAALPAAAPQVDRVLILLADQPLIGADQLRMLLEQPQDGQQPIVVARYEDGVSGNPVLLERAAWPLAAALRGDRGMSQLFARRPELLRHVDVGGTNPDVDTHADLARLSRGAAPARSSRTAGEDRSRP